MRIPPKLLLIFIAIPVIEVFLFIKIGGALGLWPTLGVIVVTAILGAALTRMQGARTMQKLQAAALSGQSPHNELFDGILIVIAGILLITPGFFTDVLGFTLLAPPVRAFVRSKVTAAVGANIAAKFQGQSPFGASAFGGEAPPAPKKSERGPKGKVIDAEIVED